MVNLRGNTKTVSSSTISNAQTACTVRCAAVRIVGRRGRCVGKARCFPAARACEEAEITADSYHLEASVRVEVLPNEKGFVPLGTGMVTHTLVGF